MLAVVGQQLGANWNSISNHLRGWDIVIFALFVVLIAFAIWKRVSTVRRRSSPRMDPDAKVS